MSSRIRERVLALAIVVMLCAGCATGSRYGNGKYCGEKDLEGPLRAEIARQFALVGYPAERAYDLSITGIRLEPTGKNSDGYYTVFDGNSIHACFEGSKGYPICTFWFAYPAGGMPSGWLISHEVLHCTLIYWDGITGHPLKFTIKGKEWTSKQVTVPGTRWPERSWRWVQGVFGFAEEEADERKIMEIVNGEYIEHVEAE